jgi:hypothetical protein
MTGTTSNESKQRYNAIHYTQLKFSVPPETAISFKAKCMSSGVSMTSEIIRLINGGNSVSHLEKPETLSVDTRRKRRKVVNRTAIQIEAVMDAERQYMENMPANLQSSRMYETAEQILTTLEEALSLLHETY